MNVAIFGATGMVGAGVLIECLDDPKVESVLAVGRRPSAVAHPKFRELILPDLFDYRDSTEHVTVTGALLLGSLFVERLFAALQVIAGVS